MKEILKTLSSLSLGAKRTKDEKDPRQKSQEPLNPRCARSPRGRAKQHGRTVLSGTAVPPSTARPCWHARSRHGRATWHGDFVPHFWLAVVIFLRVHDCALPYFPLLAILGARGFLEPLFFFLILLNAIFFIKTRRLSLKVQISHNISIITSKEADISLFSSRLSIETRINRDQIEAKRGQNRGLSPSPGCRGHHGLIVGATMAVGPTAVWPWWWLVVVQLSLVIPFWILLAHGINHGMSVSDHFEPLLLSSLIHKTLK